ncbi:alpha-L-rhamnosidase C-terminal domain-containing protein [Danxiaibacter flavus]|uniref:Alpha-L-rhamnosidase C-terminal domain-containing protein n=1 Tax=Danxiaibacter flavus TaxID=3049108 RepID=A0ABV3Z8K4_9BACT|nr:alpha-L-rhamnosidase C-terminal domain-containing protein [Chitinophagaceae bacterium DXS]
MLKRIVVVLLAIINTCLIANAQNQTINPKLLSGQWNAHWITCPDVPARAYGVYHFRKTINLTTKPDKFIVHVSADNRYRLFVNGTSVCFGPARGDLYNWFYETIDLAPYLQAGKNTIAAQVWNMAEHAAVAQVSNQTAFMLQGDDKAQETINTDKTWKVIKDDAYEPCSLDNGARLWAYMVIGPGDHVKANAYPWGWEQAGYNDESWKNATGIAQPVNAGYGTDNMWSLAPRTIPLMEETLQRIPSIRRVTGMDIQVTSLDSAHPLTIPANKTVSILFDQGVNTVAYPELVVSGGKAAAVKLTYAEAMFKDRKKGNRNDIDGREIMGNYDIFEPDGGEKRLFRPLWFRTFRYLQLDITTGDQPLVINDFYGKYTGYPFEQKAVFKSNDASLQDIWNVGWRTARLCAGENYFDCPYYEQLQYEGDTRIQSLISLYVTGDDRLMRKAINDFYKSRVPEGLTQGRYPSNRLQVIPPFSLYWVSMLYDYWMHRQDEAFLQQYLMAAAGVLDWYEKNIDKSKNMLGPMKWWGFVDWNTKFPNGVPDGATDGNSSVITLQYVYTLQQAAALFAHFGKQNEAAHYEALAKQLSKGTYLQCFDKSKGLMANTPAKGSFSQHASILAVLTQCVEKNEMQPVMKKILSDNSLSQATFYYRFYLTLALKKAGMADMYYSQLKPWRDMLAMGLTTFAENPEPTRSDCHAWSSSPNYDFLATICGIMPESAGFKTIRIEPHPGELKEIYGSMPHPSGSVEVSLQRKGENGLQGTVTLPAGTSGKFVWNNKEVALKSGKQQIEF